MGESLIYDRKNEKENAPMTGTSAAPDIAPAVANK
jgi:hypothetical protein